MTNFILLKASEALRLPSLVAASCDLQRWETKLLLQVVKSTVRGATLEAEATSLRPSRDARLPHACVNISLAPHVLGHLGHLYFNGIPSFFALKPRGHWINTTI